MKRYAAICAVVLSTAPALAAPKCETDLARLESEQRVFAVTRYGTGVWTEPQDGGRPRFHFVHAWDGTENGAPRTLTVTEISGGSDPTWGSVTDPKELKPKIRWRKLDGADLDDVIRVTNGPLEGEWKLACQGRPPIKVSFPRYDDYPAGKPYTGRIARMKVPRGLDENTRRRLQESLGGDEKPDTAGRYIRLKWPCGTACVGTALMDARNGRVIMLPTMSDWGNVDDSFEPIDGRLASRLVVLSGALNEKGIVGRHFYVMENGRLRHLRSVEVERDFPQKLE